MIPLSGAHCNLNHKSLGLIFRQSHQPSSDIFIETVALHPSKSMEEHRFFNLVKQTTKQTKTRKSFEELSIVMIKKDLN